MTLSQIGNTYLCSSLLPESAPQPHFFPWLLSWVPSENPQVASHTYNGGNPRDEDGEHKGSKNSRSGGSRAKTDSVSFYNSGSNMVTTSNRPTVRCKSWKKWDLKETFLFLKITFWKRKNTHIPSQLLDFPFLNWDYIPRTRKSTRHSTTTRYYNSSTFYITLQTTRVCTHTSWLPEKSTIARSAWGRDKVQTCYSHQGNNDTRILGEKFQEYGGRLQ